VLGYSLIDLIVSPPADSKDDKGASTKGRLENNPAENYPLE
jgi:hypothetical protein